MRVLISALLPLIGGCVGDGVPAPYGSTLTVPAGLTVGWDEAYNGVQDGIGAVVSFDVMVFDPDGLPLEAVKVDINSNYAGIYLIPSAAVLTVDGPTDPGDCPEAPDGDADEACAWFYDGETDTYYQFGSDYASAGGYAPTLLSTVTDYRGMVRVFAYIDSMPSTDGEFGSAQISVSIGVASDVFDITTG